MLGSSEWVQYYQQSISGQQAILSGGLSHDARPVAPTSATSEKTPSPSNSSSSGGHELNPKGCISKPIRRRSRASKRTPTTLLNANATNFRALVQQFTGSRSASLSFGTRRGPANLDFALASQQYDLHTPNSMAASFGYSYNFQQNQAQHQQEQEQQMHQEQQCMFSLDNNIPSDDFLLENIFYV